MAHIIITEAQVDILKEYLNKEVLMGHFEPQLRLFMKELHDNPTKPNISNFFKTNNIDTDDLIDKMTDLGLVKIKNNIIEPENARGKKHSVHTRQYTFFNDDFENKLHKLYAQYFKDGKRIGEVEKIVKF